MIVVDASVLVAALINDETAGDRARTTLAGLPFAAPEILDLEVLSALRGLRRAKILSDERATAALADLASSPLDRRPHRPLLFRAWELRHNVNPYDAAYVALAELMDVPLVTSDRHLASAPGIRCEVELLA